MYSKNLVHETRLQMHKIIIHTFFVVECLYKIQNCYDRVDISEGTHVNKTSASKECDVCHYWYFLNYSLNYILPIL